MVNIPDGVNLRIGCKEHEPSHWLANCEEIGKSAGYSDLEIDEYRLYIQLAATIIEKNSEGTK
jgi:hypothetical protein